MKKKMVFLVIFVLLLIFTFTSCGTLLSLAGAAAEDSQVKKRKDAAQSAVSLDSLETLNDKLYWLEMHAESGGNYVIALTIGEEIDTHTLSFTDKANITITLKGQAENEIIITSPYDNRFFQIGSGVTLILENISLHGSGANGYSFISVNNGGTVIMNDGAVMRGNSSDRGVTVYKDGTFIMNGGIIAYNQSSWGGGVRINDDGTFIMNGGEISYNTASGGGGGVYISTNGTFTKTGGIIQGNSATYNSSSGRSIYAGGTVIIQRTSAKRIEADLGPEVNVSYTKGTTTGGGWSL